MVPIIEDMLFKIAVAALLTLPAPAPPAPEWPQDGFGPGNTGWNPAETTVGAATIGNLKQSWTATIAHTAACPVTQLAPVLAGGRMFVLDRAGGVAAFDAATGARLWHHSAENFRAVRLAVWGGTVVAVDAPCDRDSADHRIAGLDAATGGRRWLRFFLWRSASLVVDAGIAVVGGRCGGCVSDTGYGTVGFRVTDGAEVWSRAFQIPTGDVSAAGRVILSAAADDPFPGVPRPKWTAVDIRTGTRIWHTHARMSGVRAADPAGRRFLLGDSRGLRAVDAATGRPLWRTGDGPVRTVAADDRRIYASLSGSVRAYSPVTGRSLWSRKVTAPGRPVRAHDLLYVHTGAAVAILNPATGATVALSAPFRPMRDHVVVAGGRLYVTDTSSIRTYSADNL